MSAPRQLDSGKEWPQGRAGTREFRWHHERVIHQFFRIREDSVSGHFSDEEKDETKGGDLVLLIEGAKFAFRSCLYLRCIQCHLVDMTLDAPKKYTTFEGKFGTLNYKDEVWSFIIP